MFQRLGTILAALTLLIPIRLGASEYMVYSIYKALEMGNPGETPQKDFYVNIGSNQGVGPGTMLEVIRKASTYDLNSQKLYKDIAFPIARLKVIHVEDNAAVARMDKMFTPETTPAITPRAVMVGDQVRVTH